MKLIFLLCLMLCLSLAGCGGSSKTSESNPGQTQSDSKVVVSSLTAGSYSVVLGDESAPVVGQYFTAVDGTRMLIVNDSNALASAVYKGTADGNWQRVPKATADTNITFLRSSPITLTATDLKALAGNYTTLVQGSAVGFSLGADGKISAASGASCKITGSVAAEWVQGVRKLSLSLSGCGTLPASLQGVLIQDADYAPVTLRLVADDGSQIVELWAYAEQ